MWTMALGPLQPAFATAPDAILLKMLGGFMLLLGITTSIVRWNKTNGPPIAIITSGCAANLAYSTFTRDGGFVPSLLYVYAGVMIMGALALFSTKNVKLQAKKD
jgi:hypothetical protein